MASFWGPLGIRARFCRDVELNAAFGHIFECAFRHVKYAVNGQHHMIAGFSNLDAVADPRNGCEPVRLPDHAAIYKDQAPNTHVLNSHRKFQTDALLRPA